MSVPATKRVDVLVVGGGPAGMVAGCLLAKAGLRTLVVERNENFDRELRGEVLQPRFHKAMMDMGLRDHVAQYPHEEILRAQVYFSGSHVGSVNLGRLDPRTGPTWWMTQPDLLRALDEYGTQSPSFERWFHAPIRKLEGNVAWVEHAGEDVRIEAKVIVAADGRFSMVRRLLDFEMAYDHHDLDVVWFILPRPAHFEHSFGFFLTPVRDYLILPKYPNLLQCGIVYRPGEFGSVRHRPLDELRAELAKAHPVFADFAAGLEDFTPFRPLIGSTAMVTEWARDHVVLIGDAAHTCSPAGGIGVAVAVETACVAVSVILDCFERNDFSRRALGRIQAMRHADVRRVHIIQHRMGRILIGTRGILRVGVPLGIRIASTLKIMPLFARQLLIQRQPLPDLQSRLA